MRTSISHKFICVILASLLPAGQPHAGEITGNAKTAVASNKDRADAWAKELARRDLEEAFSIVAKKIAQLDATHTRMMQLKDRHSALIKDFRDFSSVNLTTLNKTRNEVEKLRTEYEELVRRRFDTSWGATEASEMYRNVSPILKEVIQVFRNTCQAGRSDFGYRHDIPAQPLPSKYHFDLMVIIKGSYPTIMYQGLNYHNRHKTRSSIIETSGATSGVSASILATGATGAWATASAIAFPAATAVLAVAVTVQHFANMEKANEIAAEVARTEMLKFTQAKRDDYIAAKYRELCQAQIGKLDEVASTIDVLEQGGAPANALIDDALRSEEKMKTVAEKIDHVAAARCRMTIATQAKAGKCVASTSDAKAIEKAGCTIDDNKIVQPAVPVRGCTIELLSDGTYQNEDKDSELEREFDPDESYRLAIHKLIIALGPNKTSLMNSFSEMNWNLIDEEKERAFSKLMEFISLARKMYNEGLINHELASTREFQSLRGRFIDLTAQAIDAVFARADANAFSKNFLKFESDFNAYYRRHSIHNEVQGLQSCLRLLKEILGGK